MLSAFFHLNRHLAEVDRLVTLTARTPAQPPARSCWSITETQEAWLVHGLLPGWASKDIVVEVKGDVMTLTGTATPGVPEGFVSLRRERPERALSRTLRIPDDVDSSEISAAARDGVLTITLPRRPKAEPRRIAVNAA